MRCPKCGYISFDHLDACNKCSKDLSGVIENFGGGLSSAEAPRFLVMNPMGSEPVEPESFEDEGIAFDDDYLDDDLDVLLSSDEGEDEGDMPVISFSDDEEGVTQSDDVAAEADFDFSFDDEASSLVPEEEGDEIALSIPGELSDMSDLSPSDEIEDDEIAFDFSLDDEEGDGDALEVDPVVEEPLAEDIDIDIDTLSLELDSVLSDDGTGDGAFELSLDDINSSEMNQTGGAPALNPDGSVDMDVDLDFELDLGGLTLHKKEEKV